MTRKFIAIAVIALCAVSLGAQAMGFEVAASLHAFLAAHPDVALGLAGVAFLGETQNFNPAEIKAALDKISAEVKSSGEKALTEVKSFGKMAEDTKAEVDKLLMKHGELQANLQHTQQALAKLEANGAGGDVQHQSFGEQFVASDSFKTFAAQASRKGRADMTFKAAITTLTTDADGSAGDLVRSTRVPGIIAPPDRRMTVRDLITPGRMDGSVLEYVKETGFTNAADTTAETAAKPESTMKFDLVTTTAKVIAHYVKASRQILSDASQLASYIDGRLRYGLAYKEETQLLNGNGIGQNLLGIVPQASAYALPTGITAPAGATKLIDMLRVAMLQAHLAEYPATGHVLNPIDWAKIEMAKDGEGRYLIGQPQGTIGATLWNLPVVATQAMEVDKFLTGAFRLGAQVFDRWEARVEVATENEDDFIKNMVTILAEERLALAVYRPEAFVYGDFGDVT